MTDNDSFSAEVIYSTNSGLQHIIADPVYSPWQQNYAAMLLKRRESFATECARIDRLGAT